MHPFSSISRGDPSLPPLIFLHGFLGAKEDWAAMFPFFEKKFYCTALDLPGHGATPYCDGILAALQVRLDAPLKPVLIGYSMGGRIAMQLQPFASAVILLSAHPGLTDEKEKEARLKIDLMWGEKLLRLPFEQFLVEWYAQPLFHHLQNNPSLLQNTLKRRAAQNPTSLAQVMLQLSLAKMPAVRCDRPTLFLCGEEDLKYRDLYSRLPKSVAMHSIKNCGHVIHLEKPKECAEIILNWLDPYANS